MIEKNCVYPGGCLCGAVRYELRGPSVGEQHCCCRDCQKATGTGHATIIAVHRSQLVIVSGKLKAFTVTGTSGGDVTRHFCENCGGRIYTSGTKPGELILVQAGTLDDPNVVEPNGAIYASQALRWDHFGPDVVRYERMGPYSANSLAAMKGDVSYMTD